MSAPTADRRVQLVALTVALLAAAVTREYLTGTLWLLIGIACLAIFFTPVAVVSIVRRHRRAKEALRESHEREAGKGARK